MAGKRRVVETGKKSVLQIVFGRTMIIIVLLALHFLLTFALFLEFTSYIPIYIGGTTALMAVMLTVILNTRDNPALKLSWCTLVAISPVFGTMLYFFVRFDVGHRVFGRAIERSIAESRQHTPDQQPTLEKIKREEPDFYGTAYYLNKHAVLGMCTADEVRYLPVGEAMLEQMLLELEKAEKFIFLEYFIIEQGKMWGQILEILERKAREGVEVRVLYDGTCSLLKLPASYPKTLEKKGIRCKLFSPLQPFVSTHYNNRDHRKILVVDGVTAMTGGINLADEYINHTHPFGHWKDTAVLVRGQAARSFTQMFLQMWNALEKEREYEKYLPPMVPAAEGRGYVIPYGDSPTDKENVGEMVYLNMLNQAKDYVYIMTPYLILDNEMVTALCLCAKRGVDVRLVQPQVPDHKYAYVLARRHYKELMEAGVKVYAYIPGFVHAKVFLADDTQAVVGTINLDYRSLYLHYECAALLYKVPAIGDIRRDFDNIFSLSKCLDRQDLRRESLLSRLAGVLLKVVAPLM